MNGYNFTERARKVLALARDEAGRFRHEYVGTEHLLLGLLREDGGIGAAVLRNLGVDLARIQQKFDEILTTGKAPALAHPDLPYTTRAKKVLELAMAEARDLTHAYVGTEHLLLGLIREEKGIAAQVLSYAGVTERAARAEALRLLGADQPLDRPEGTSEVAAVTVEIRFTAGTVRRNVFPTVAEAIEFLRQ